MAKFAHIALAFVLAGSSDTANARNASEVAKAEDTSVLADYQQSDFFAKAVARAQKKLDGQLVSELNVPVPADAGGGYTHEQHKRNYQSIYDAGRLYAITGDQKYADFAKRLLIAYADMYPTLGEHPKKKEQTPGRLFWQSLNESVWLVVSIQGYDAIKATLSAEERSHIETNLLKNMATFLSEGQPQTFDKVHNHGTWAAAAVGMTGYVLDDMDMVEKALLGLDKSGKGGFLRQLDELFSPTGYYSEGPYYQRYALMPFVLFAAAIEENQPEREIFKRRDGILMKAIYSTIELSYADLFFPINDALKDKGLNTMELMHAVSIAYDLTGDNSLLPIAEKQSTLPLTKAGLKVSKALAAGKAEAFPYKSMQHLDGAAGDDGALAVLRSGSDENHLALVVKNTAQGMGHGHFDKLNWLMYDGGHEIIQDYGAARFLNVEAKYGGHYLPENKTFAKQTIAHNTLVVDETSHFRGRTKIGNKYHPEQLVFEARHPVQISVARMENAYQGVEFTRAMALVSDEQLEMPFVVDVFKVKSDAAHQYDLPLHYNGHLIDTNFELKTNMFSLVPLGVKNGYQHMWLTARGSIAKDQPARVTWLKDKRFYTYTTIALAGSELLFTRLGANDPKFNLRDETAVVTRVHGAKDATFVSLLEPHGQYNPALEYTLDSHSQIKDLRRISEGGNDLLLITTVHDKVWAIALSWNTDTSKEHSIQLGQKTANWKGFYHVFEWRTDEIQSEQTSGGN
jgi:hypothetical protein